MGAIKKSGLLCIVVLFLSISVYARSFDAQVEAVDNTINLNQLATYKLTIRNDLETIEEFKVKTLDYPAWDVKTEPVINPIQLSISPGEEKDLELFVTPMHVANYGVYDVSLQVELVSKKEKLSIPLRVNVISPQAGTYVETVIASISMDDKIDPSKEIPISILLNNQNIIEYPEIIITVESNLIKDVVKESLGKREKKTISLVKSIDPQTPPQEDAIIVKLVSNNKTLHTEIKRIEVIGKEDISQDKKVEKRFLKKVEEITLVNNGNLLYERDYKVPISLINELFTSSNPKGGQFIKEDSGRYLSIPLKIEPGVKATLTITKNYISILAVILLAGVIILVYYLLRSPLIIAKKAANISYKEGGVSELKVILTISNRGKGKLRNIEIVDKVPHIADLEKGLTIGTLHPSKILKHDNKGTIIKWVIDELEAGDERVISYKIKSHLSILGQFNLSPTIGKFQSHGKEVVTHSNSLAVTP